jgi:hypothetical protein
VALSHAKQPWFKVQQKEGVIYEPGGYPMGPYPHFWVEPERRSEFETCSVVRRCIWAWRIFVETALSTGAVLPPHQYLELRYEEMVLRPEAIALNLLDFLEIADPDSRFNFQRAVSTVRADLVGQWKQGLTETDQKEIAQEAGDLLARLGYAGSEHATEVPTSEV